MATEQQCKRAMTVHRDWLTGLANVEGLGVREIEIRNGPTVESELRVAVYVREKIPRDELAPGDIIPKHLELNEDDGIIQVPTAVFEIGEIQFGVSSAGDATQG